MTPGLYLAAALAFAVAIAGGWAAFERARYMGAQVEVERLHGLVSKQEAALKRAEEVNAANARNVERMLEQAQRDDEAAKALAETVAMIREAVDETRTKLDELEANDEESRDWIRVPVPGGVRQLLNRPDRPG